MRALKKPAERGDHDEFVFAVHLLNGLFRIAPVELGDLREGDIIAPFCYVLYHLVFLVYHGDYTGIAGEVAVNNAPVIKDVLAGDEENVPDGDGVYDAVERDLRECVEAIAHPFGRLLVVKNG